MYLQIDVVNANYSKFFYKDSKQGTSRHNRNSKQDKSKTSSQDVNRDGENDAELKFADSIDDQANGKESNKEPLEMQKDQNTIVSQLYRIPVSNMNAKIIFVKPATEVCHVERSVEIVPNNTGLEAEVQSCNKEENVELSNDELILKIGTIKDAVEAHEKEESKSRQQRIENTNCKTSFGYEGSYAPIKAKVGGNKRNMEKILKEIEDQSDDYTNDESVYKVDVAVTNLRKIQSSTQNKFQEDNVGICESTDRKQGNAPKLERNRQVSIKSQKNKCVILTNMPKDADKIMVDKTPKTTSEIVIIDSNDISSGSKKTDKTTVQTNQMIRRKSTSGISRFHFKFS